MNIKDFILYLLILTNLAVAGQRTETEITFYETKNRIVLEIENDLLFNTDSYYTSGVAISYSNKRIKKMPTQLILNLFNSENDYSISGFGIQQRMFTPYSIEEPNSIKNDRPYSAYILISNYAVLINTKNNLKVSNEIAIGVMGEFAGGEEAQTLVHKTIGSPVPIGWDNQLGNAFLIDYQFRVEKTLFRNWLTNHLSPFAEARIGTLTDRIKVGFITKWGNKNECLRNIGNLKNKFVWEWIFEANLQGVFYDATLEGGLFNNDKLIGLPKQNIISQQYQLRMGVNLSYKRFSLRYMVKLNSSDFVSAAIHRYGSANFGYSF